MSYALSTAITGPEAWLGRDMAVSTDWIYPVSSQAVAEIDAALRGVQRRGLTWPKFGREDFPLPTFSRELDGELKDLYWGVGAHLGWQRYQNAMGELIGEVRDENRRYGEVKEPSMDPTLGRSSRNKARSAGPLRFHTDRCDVVTLLTVRKAPRGGLSKIVSAVSVSNAILERRPDLHALLCHDYWRSRQGEEAGGERKVFPMPIFCLHEGKFSTRRCARSSASRWSFSPVTCSS
jgi:hypothetical protein